MQYTVTATRDASSSLIRSAKTTTPLMNSMCIFQSSMSNYLVNSTQARSEVSFLRTLSLNATFRYSGTWMGPPTSPPRAPPGTVLAWRHWWLGCSPCQYKTKISRGGGDDKRKEIEKKTTTNGLNSPKRELVSLNDWRMLAQRNSAWHFKNTLKSFRGLQFKDRKTSDRHVRKQGGGGKRRHRPVSVGNAPPKRVAQQIGMFTQSTEIERRGNEWCDSLTARVGLQHVSHLSLFIYLFFIFIII